MKKSLLLLGLICTAACLTACGSKKFNMSFEEALEAANHSAFQDIIAQNDNFEQDFAISGNYDVDWTKIDASISSNSKQSLTNKNSESSTKIAANITAEGETIKADWTLDLKLVDNVIYLSLSSLNITWSEDLAMIEMMAEWFKNQWYSISLDGLGELPDTFSILKDSKKINERTREIAINEELVVYNWKYTQFNWYNAWKFSLDNKKLNELIKEYYDSINSSLGGEWIEIPEINIQNFEWYLVITWKDKVTTVIENMEIEDEGDVLSINWYGWEDFEMYVSNGEETIISVTALKKGWKYDVSVALTDYVSINWTVSAKLSKSSINISFDGKLTVKSETEGESDTVIPFNGSWKYNWIAEFTTTAPEEAQDLAELLWSYLGMMWWYDYDEDLYGDGEIYYEWDNELSDEANNGWENAESEEWSEEPAENTEEATETVEETVEPVENTEVSE